MDGIGGTGSTEKFVGCDTVLWVDVCCCLPISKSSE